VTRDLPPYERHRVGPFYSQIVGKSGGPGRRKRNKGHVRGKLRGSLGVPKEARLGRKKSVFKKFLTMILLYLSREQQKRRFEKREI